jgi:hypothetical protein
MNMSNGLGKGKGEGKGEGEGFGGRSWSMNLGVVGGVGGVFGGMGGMGVGMGVGVGVGYSLSKLAWGSAVWTFLHTMAEKVMDENNEFVSARAELMEVMYAVVTNLPCPVCSAHAKEYFDVESNKLSKIQTKEQLRRDERHRIQKRSAAYLLQCALPQEGEHVAHAIPGCH